MRRTLWHQRESGRWDVKMTPMIDVVFLLLIFFVCTASFQTPEEVLPSRLSLAGTTAADIEIEPPEEDLDEVVVRVVRRGGRVGWEINHRPYDTLQQVRAVLVALVEIQADLPVILDVDGDVPLGSVIDLYDLCRLTGFERVQFAAAAPE